MKPLRYFLLSVCISVLNVAEGWSQCSVSLSASTTVACSGESFIISATTSGCGTGLQYLWSTGDMTSTISTSVINQTYGNLNSVYTVTVTGSLGSTTASKSIVIRPEPQFSVFNATPSICSEDSSLIIMNSNISSVLYSYSVIQSGVTGATNGNGAVIKHKLTLTGNYNGNVLYQITPRISNCYGNPQSAVVDVIQKPQIFASISDTVICSGTAVNFQLSSDQMGAVCHYISSGQAVNGHSSGSGNNISQVLNNIASDTSVVIYKVFASTLNCNSDTAEIIVRVLPDIQLFSSMQSQQICSGSEAVINYTVFPLGSNITWNVTPVNVTGASAGSGNLIQQTLYSTSVSGKVIYHVTGTNGSCVSPVKNDTVFVTPLPDISYSPPGISSFCSGTSTLITLGSLYPGVDYYWEPLPSTVTGASAGNGPVISQVLSNNGVIADTIEYRAYTSLNGCAGDSASILIRIKPVPELNASPDSIVICSGNAVNIQYTSSIPGTAVSWMVQAQNVNGWYNGSGNTVSQILSSGNQQGYAVYTATGVFDGCISLPAETYVTVNACLAVHEPLPTDESVVISDACHIYLNSNDKAVIRIIDFSGRLVYENLKPEKNMIIDLSGYRPGYYFLRITTGEFSKIKRIKVNSRN